MTVTAPLESARQALSAGRWAEAADGFGAALAERESPEAHEGLGRALWWLGRARESRRSRERAFALYRDRGDPGRAVMVAVDLCVAWVLDVGNVSAASGWLARARRLDAHDSTGWLTLMDAFLGQDPEERRRALTDTISIAERRHDRDLALVALADLGVLDVQAGRVEGGLALLDEALAGTVSGDCQRLETMVWNLCSMLSVCSLLGDVRRATEWCNAADDFLDSHHCPYLRAQCRAHYGSVLVRSGEWPRAEAQLQEALDLSTTAPGDARDPALAALAELKLRQGRAADAEDLLVELDDGALALRTRARLFLACGEPERAVSLLRSGLTELGETDPRAHALSATLVDALLACHEDHAAGDVAVTLGRAATGPHYPEAGALAVRAAGLVAAAKGEGTTARRLLTRARDGFLALQLPYDAACTRLDLARSVATSDPEVAIAEAGAAYDALTRLGAKDAVAEAAGVLRSLGVRPRAGPGTLVQLTEREREVLGLVEAGLTNPQIAERLYLSPRTVAHHVSSILAKLGLTTRSEAAAYSARAAARNVR